MPPEPQPESPPIVAAAGKGDLPAVEGLLAAGAGVESRDEENASGKPGEAIPERFSL